MSNIQASSKLSSFLFILIQATWGVFQNALGFLIYLFYLLKEPRDRRFSFRSTLVTCWRRPSSLSLGLFIFLGSASERVLVHEYGHSLQSAILGPLYLPVIGLPSFTWASSPALERYRKSGHVRYSSFYPERWANELGRRYTHHEPIDF